MPGTANDKGNEYKYSEVDLQSKVKTENDRVTKDILVQLGYGDNESLKDVLEKKKITKQETDAAERERLEKDKNWKKLQEKDKAEFDANMAAANLKVEKYRKLHVEGNVNSAILTEAARQGAVDSQDVVDLLGKSVTINDDDTFAIKDVNGQLITADQAVKDLLEKKPHLRKANFTPSTIKEGGDVNKDGGGKPKEEKNLVKTKYEGQTDGKVNQANMLKELEALNLEFRGQHLEGSYNKELNLIMKKYKQGRA